MRLCARKRCVWLIDCGRCGCVWLEPRRRDCRGVVQDEAASHIQASFRGHRVRKEASLRHMRDVIHRNKVDAAITIQAAIRGWLGRIAARRHKVEVVRRFMRVQQMHLAAAIIQSAFFRKMYPESGSESGPGYTYYSDDDALIHDHHLDSDMDSSHHGEYQSGRGQYHGSVEVTARPMVL